MAEDKSVFDSEAALDAVDGQPVILRELAQLFVDRHQELVDKIAQAADQTDFQALVSAVHGARGCVGFYRCRRLEAALQDLHACAIGENAEGIATHRQRVQDEFARLVAALNRFVAQGSDSS